MRMALLLLVWVGLSSLPARADVPAQNALVQGGDLTVVMHEGKPHVFYVSSGRVVKHVVWDGKWKFLGDIAPRTDYGWTKFGPTFEGNVSLAAASVHADAGQIISLVVLAKIGGTHISKDSYVVRQFDISPTKIDLNHDELCHNINSDTMSDGWLGISVYQGVKMAHFDCVHKNFAWDLFWFQSNQDPHEWRWSYVDYHWLGAGSTKVAGPATGWFMGKDDHVVVRDRDGDLIERVGLSGIYKQTNNITELAQHAKQAVGDPVGWAIGNTQHVVYEAKDRALHELWWDGTWHFTELTKEAAAPANITGPLVAHVLGTSQHVFYRSIDQHIRELVWTAETKKWQHHDIWASARGRVLAAHKKVVSYVQGTSQHVLYLGADGNVQELFHDGTAWKTNSITAEAATTP